jgi:hypothetical protein
VLGPENTPPGSVPCPGRVPKRVWRFFLTRRVSERRGEGYGKISRG